MGSVTLGGSSHTVPGQELGVGWERAVYRESVDMYCLGAGITRYLFNTIRSTWSTVPVPSGYGHSAIIGIVLDNHIELELYITVYLVQELFLSATAWLSVTEFSRSASFTNFWMVAAGCTRRFPHCVARVLYSCLTL